MTENEFLRELVAALMKQNAELLAQVASANEQITAANAQIAVLTERIEELLEQLDKKNKNSRNSSKPPSSDGYSKPAPKSLKKPSGKKPGGQKGHKGSGMKIPRKPDAFVPHFPVACLNCPNRALCEMKVAERRYEEDISIQTHVTAHLQMKCCCPRQGGKTLLGEFPDNIKATKQYGANLVAFASALSTVGMVSVDRIHKLLNNVFQVGISTGAIQGFLNRLHEKVKLPVKYIRNKVSQVPVMNCDETGLRVNEKLRWLHCMSGSGWVYYALHDKRGCEAMDEIGIIPDYHGIMIHDCWKPYFKYEKAEHALCCAHILRELVYAEEVKHQQWAKPLRELLCEMLTERNRLAELGESRFSKEQADAYSSRYDALVTQGLEANPLQLRKKGQMGAPKKGEVRSLLERLRDRKQQILRFAADWYVPFTNNAAEQDIRFSKVKLKVSGCFRTKHGAEEYADIMSYTNTAYKHNVGFFDAIKAAFTGNALTLVAQWG